MGKLKTELLIIKNMVSHSCLKLVSKKLSDLGIEVLELRLGKGNIRYDASKINLSEINHALIEEGFELLKSKNEKLVEGIKITLLKELQNPSPTLSKINLSDYLTQELNTNYTKLSKTFSRMEGITIQKYFILLKVEKVKELIEYEELSFKEIAWQLGYRSVNHLAGQFKRIEGISMGDYKELSRFSRKPFNKITK